MTTSQETITGSFADYWINKSNTGGVWRTARKENFCGTCKKKSILPGDRYLDTGERIDIWATYKECEKHANQSDIA